MAWKTYGVERKAGKERVSAGLAAPAHRPRQTRTEDIEREERKLSAKERLKDILNKPRLVTTAKSNPPTLYFCRQ